MEERKYIVYMHKNKENNKVYIGTTKQTLEIRSGKNGTNYRKQPFFKDIVKYGWDNFEHIVLCENLTKQEAEEKEKEYIKEHHANDKKYGYNIEEGGFKKEKEEGNVSVIMAMPISLKKELQEEAKAEGLTLTTYIRYLLIQRKEKIK